MKHLTFDAHAGASSVTERPLTHRQCAAYLGVPLSRPTDWPWARLEALMALHERDGHRAFLLRVWRLLNAAEPPNQVRP